MSRPARRWLLCCVGVVGGIGAALLAMVSPALIRPGQMAELAHLRPGGAGPPLASRTVVVVLDGVRRDPLRAAFEATPEGKKLLGAAAVFAGRAGHPSLSRPMYATLLSGATPRISAVPSNAHRQPLLVDSVVASARRFGIDTLVRDDRTGWWWQLLRSPPSERAGSLGQVLGRLRTRGRSLTYVHVLDADRAAHRHGASGPEYAAAIRHGANVVLRVAAALDLDRDFLLVTADHGHRDRGGHGGQERDVTAIPLWFAGARVRPGRYGAARSRDVAPTVAVVAGLPLPAHSEGRPLLEGLSLPPTTADAVAQRWLSQRWRLANALLTSLGRPLEPPPAPAESERVFPAARKAMRAVGEKVEAAFEARLRREQWIRAAMASPLVLVPLLLLRRRRWSSRALVLALASAVTFWGLYAATFPFTLSAVRSRGEFFLYVGLMAVLGQAVIGAAAVWWARRRGGPRLLEDTAAWTVTLSLLELGVAFAWWGIGTGDSLPTPQGYVVPGLVLARFAAAAVLWSILAAAAPRIAVSEERSPVGS